MALSEDDDDVSRFVRHESADDEQRALEELHQLLEHVHAWQVAGAQNAGSPVQPGSSLAGDDKRSDPFQVSIAAHQALGLGVDHLHCLRAAVVEARSLHMAAPFTLLRAALETTCTVHYVLGPRSRPERIARSLQLARDNARQEDGAIRLMLDDPDEILARDRSYTKRLARIEEVAARREDVSDHLRALPGRFTYSAVVRAAGDTSGVGRDLTEACWRICSGMAHGKEWSMVGLLDRAEVRRASAGVLNARMTAPATTVAQIAYFVVVLHAMARDLVLERSTNHLSG